MGEIRNNWSLFLTIWLSNILATSDRQNRISYESDFGQRRRAFVQTAQTQICFEKLLRKKSSILKDQGRLSREHNCLLPFFWGTLVLWGCNWTITALLQFRVQWSGLMRCTCQCQLAPAMPLSILNLLNKKASKRHCARTLALMGKNLTAVHQYVPK